MKVRELIDILSGYDEDTRVHIQVSYNEGYLESSDIEGVDDYKRLGEMVVVISGICTYSDSCV